MYGEAKIWKLTYGSYLFTCKFEFFKHRIIKIKNTTGLYGQHIVVVGMKDILHVSNNFFLLCTDNLVEDLLGDFEYEVQAPYLLYRNAAQEVNGIWFYNSQDCEAVANLFSRYCLLCILTFLYAHGPIKFLFCFVQ